MPALPPKPFFWEDVPPACKEDAFSTGDWLFSRWYRLATWLDLCDLYVHMCIHVYMYVYKDIDTDVDMDTDLDIDMERGVDVDEA